MVNDGKKFDRRTAIKLTGISALTWFMGCHDVSSYSLKKDCEESDANKKLRVMGYNIAFNTRGNNHNLDRIIDIIKREDADIVCMNEVVHNTDQARYIARGLCYNHVIELSLFKLGLKLGNAVISKYPLRLNSDNQFGKTLQEKFKHLFKGFVDFDVMFDERSLNFVLTHYDHQGMETKNKETTMILEHLGKKKDPFVLVGDLNSMPGDSCFDRLIESGLLHNPYAGIPTSLNSPNRAIDHILVSEGLRIENYHTVHSEYEPSDHLPIVGDVIFD